MGHRCKKLFVIEYNPILDYEDDPDAPVGSDLEISLPAIMGIHPRLGQTMRIMVTINKLPLVALLNSGSTHNFIAKSVVRQAALSLQSWTDLRVTVANDDRMVSHGVCRDLTVCIGEEAFSLDCYAIPLDGFDVVLGVQWLGTLGPIIWDFSNMTMTFGRAGHQIT